MRVAEEHDTAKKRDLEKEKTKNKYLKQLSNLGKNKYLRSDIDFSQISDLSGLLEDNDEIIEHPNEGSALAQAVCFFIP